MARGEWAERWRALALRDQMTGAEGEAQMVERWRNLAGRLDDGSETRPDPILDFVLDRLSEEMTVIDIGAAVGRWTIPIAERVRAVSAVEPVEAMRRVLSERVAARGLTNVRLVESPWLDASVGPHDVAVAAYSMYTSPDLAAFARKMDACARRACFMALRIPAPDGVIGELAERIHGEWHDSPNFVVGYNVLLEAGFAPNVFVEPLAVLHWTDPSMADAVGRAHRHLGLSDGRYDGLIVETLERRLTRTADGYRWPDWMRSAIVWWEPAPPSNES